MVVFGALIKHKDWPRVTEALKHSKNNYDDICNDVLANEVVKNAEANAVPSSILAQAFKSAETADTSLAVIGALLLRSDGKDIVKSLREYSGSHYTRKFQRELEEYITSHQEDKKPAEPAEPLIKPRATIPLTFWQDMY